MNLLDLLDDLEVERIARVCHEANRALQQNNGEVVNFPWENTSQDMRNSTISGVRAVLEGGTPVQLHGAWSADRVAQGWVWGPVKDFAKKQHPCLVPYADLSEDQKAKDALFSAIVNTLALYV